MQKLLIGCVVTLLMLLAACGDSAEDPAKIVEKYLQAKVAGDAETIGSLLCAEREADLERESQTFSSVSGVQLEGMTCSQVGETTTVQCEGKIVALYGTEKTEFPLVSYRVVQEDGEWKWCGEAEE